MKNRSQNHCPLSGYTHTSKFKSWKLITVMAFPEDSKALAFERYLKTG
ncbi:GIY-YIG nuclease family protein [Nitrospira sp. T9]